MTNAFTIAIIQTYDIDTMYKHVFCGLGTVICGLPTLICGLPGVICGDLRSSRNDLRQFSVFQG